MMLYILFPIVFIAAAISVFPLDWAGWVLAFLSFTIIPIFLGSKPGLRIISAIFISLFLHHTVAAMNSYFSLLPGAAEDASVFHETGVLLATEGSLRFAVGSEFYSNALGLLYRALGPSHFMGEETSVFAFALSCIVLVKMMDLLGVTRHRAACVLAYGLAPALALFGSFTMREAWETLFFLTATYGFLLFRTTTDPIALLGGLASALLLAILHKAMMVFVPFFVNYAVVVRIGRQSRAASSRVIGIALSVLILGSIITVMSTELIPGAPTFASMASGDAMESAATYRERSLKGARAEYGVSLDRSSPVSLAITGATVFVYYMMAPFPWQVHNAFDAFACVDAIVRAVLILCSVLAWRRMKAHDSRVYGYLITLYLALSLLWAMGTINYGTAIRHHVIGLWIPIVLGLPYLLDLLTSVRRRKATRYPDGLQAATIPEARSAWNS